MIRAKPSILSVKRAAVSRLFCIESVRLQFENGREAEYERIAGISGNRRSVIVVALVDPSKVHPPTCIPICWVRHDWLPTQAGSARGMSITRRMAKSSMACPPRSATPAIRMTASRG